MALQLVIGIRCSSRLSSLALRDLLGVDTRPLFEEDVDSDYQSEYRAICDLDYPDSIEMLGNELWVQWIDNESVKDISFDSLIELFESPRFDLIAAHEIPDDPLICGEEEGWCWSSSIRSWQWW